MTLTAAVASAAASGDTAIFLRIIELDAGAILLRVCLCVCVCVFPLTCFRLLLPFIRTNRLNDEDIHFCRSALAISLKLRLNNSEDEDGDRRKGQKNGSNGASKWYR